MFFWLRCTFCRRGSSCNARYRVGERHFYPGTGFVSTGCPKAIKRATPFYGMTAREIGEEVRKQAKEEEKQ